MSDGPPPPPPLPAVELIRFALRGVLIVVAVVAVYYAMLSFVPGGLGDPAVLEAKPEPLSVPLSGPGAGKLALVLSMRNIGSQDLIVTAKAPCKIIQWVISNEQGDFVQAHADECPDTPIDRTLTPSEIITDRVEIALRTGSYAANQRYRVLYRYWGREGLVLFRTENGPGQ